MAEDYEVGYGKPPEQTRFKKGQSGNPKGRAKGTRNFSTDVKSTLNAEVRVTRDGRPHKISTQEALLLRLREKALSGDARTLDRMIALAQTYNNGELAQTYQSSADDLFLLDILKSRILSGAAGPARTTKKSETAPEKSDSRPGDDNVISHGIDRSRAPKKRSGNVPRRRLNIEKKG